MHSTKGPHGTTFHHNGDFSGAVLFTAEAADGSGPVTVRAPFQAFAASLRSAPRDLTGPVAITARPEAPADAGERVHVSAPAMDVATLVAERVRDELISWAENADPRELLDDGAAGRLARWAAEQPDWG